MELKVHCACGTKYKFDPVNGHMPTVVSCPVCGADGTAQANEIIRQTLGVPATVPAKAPPSDIGPPPPGVPVVASPTAVTPVSARLRINHPVSKEPAAPCEPTPAGKAVGFAPPTVARPVRSPSTIFAKLKVALTVTLILAGLAAGVWKFGRKWYNRISAVVDVAQVFGEAGGHSDDNWNFSFEDCVVLFIKHTNQTEVAQACMDYWKNTLHKPLAMVSNTEAGIGGGQFELWPEHKSYVEFWGDLE